MGLVFFFQKDPMNRGQKCPWRRERLEMNPVNALRQGDLETIQAGENFKVLGERSI
jgi:hypothetical protein